MCRFSEQIPPGNLCRSRRPFHFRPLVEPLFKPSRSVGSRVAVSTDRRDLGKVLVHDPLECFRDSLRAPRGRIFIGDGDDYVDGRVTVKGVYSHHHKDPRLHSKCNFAHQLLSLSCSGDMILPVPITRVTIIDSCSSRAFGIGVWDVPLT